MTAWRRAVTASSCRPARPSLRPRSRYALASPEFSDATLLAVSPPLGVAGAAAGLLPSAVSTGAGAGAFLTGAAARAVTPAVLKVRGGRVA
jgi:hypothetical protein